MILQDLECLAGKLISGNLTPVVYELLRQTAHKKELLTLLRAALNNADNKHENQTAGKNDDSRLALADRLTDRAKPVSIRGALGLTIEQIPEMSASTLKILNNSLAYSDFDPVMQRSHGSVRSSSENTIRLEDVPAADVQRYAKQVLIGCKLNTRGSVRELDTKEETRVAGIDEDRTDEAELLTDSHGDYPKTAIVRAKERLPYLLRHLHIRSRSCGVHLISLAIARANLKGLRPKTDAPVTRGFYTCTVEGDIITRVEKAYVNTAHFAVKWAVDWVCGAYPDDEAYRAMLGLYTACDILGVDFGKENSEDYSPDLFNRLVVTGDS